MLREAARMVGVVPNAAYRHFADRDELLAAVCTEAMGELAARMAADVARVRGKYGDAAAARRRLRAIGRAYLEFARAEPGLFVTAFSLPHQHAYGARDGGTGPEANPLDQLRAVLDELVDAGVPGRHGDPAAARGRLGAIGLAYLRFAREEPGLFATAFALPQQHAYGAPEYAAPDEAAGPDRTPLGQLRTVLDELADAGVLDPGHRDGIEYPIWSAVHGLAVLAGEGPLRDAPEAARRHIEELTLTFIGRGL